MPDPEKLIPTLNRSIELTRSTPGRKGRVVSLQDVDELVIAGDMHGNLASFQTIYKTADLQNHPRRHLVIQELIHSPFRYSMGGDKSHQLVDLYAALKCQFPKQVHYLLGNHELSQWTNRRVIKNEEDFNEMFMSGIHQAYGNRGREIYDRYLDLFSVLPMALRTPNRIFLSHSTPAPKYLDQFDLTLLEKDDLPSEIYHPNGIGYGLVWGRNTTEGNTQAFLKKVDADWVICGHIPCEEGFLFANPAQLILDSAYSPGAFAILSASHPITVDELRSSIRML
jgi:hypothetical protein